MELVNRTPLASEVFVTSRADTPDGQRMRSAILIAKATLQVGDDGRMSLVSDDPLPVLDSEIETDLGVVPRDTHVPNDDGLVDVGAHAAAYGENGRPTTSRLVELWVGEHYRALRVTGERAWIGRGDSALISDPEPFVRMPLTWERAFGGTHEVWIDEHTALDVSHAPNQLGKGFDFHRAIDSLARTLGCPASFPRYDDHRALPNIEDPYAPITRWEDEPRPSCWAPMPLDLGERVVRTQRGEAPQWRAPIAPGMAVHLLGCTPSGAWSFTLPALRPIARYELGTRSGEIRLHATQLLLLPEQRRFAITYAAGFRFRVTDDRMPRSLVIQVQ
jgi:hypothetical protein